MNVAIRKIENNENQNDATYESAYAKPGRKKIPKDALHTEIRSIMGNDNSLTQIGCKEKLSKEISLSQLCKEMKSAGLTRKRLKKKSSVLLTSKNQEERQLFCATILGLRTRPILFLDESGFNLHTSINYGYSTLNEDAVLYQPKSKGKNMSLCAIISSNGVENYKIIDGAYNRDIFMTFLESCNKKNIFQHSSIVVMDNARFHHCEEIKMYLLSKNVKIIYLPPYSPDLNPIENVFSTIKSTINRFRPRAQSRPQLQSNIELAITELQVNDFSAYYKHFWEIVNAINNRQL